VSLQNPLEIVNALLEKAGLSSDKRVQKALDVAQKAHAEQKRGDEAYINHILRATAFLLETGAADANSVCSILLHDSVEDQAEKLVEMSGGATQNENVREAAFAYLEREFGSRVRDNVFAATNPEKKVEYPEDLSPDEIDSIKISEYTRHLKEVIEDPIVCLIKLSDFSDNGMKTESLTPWLARKYAQVYDIFRERINRPDVPIYLSEKRNDIQARLTACEVCAERKAPQAFI
jgi:(p)ppGpp synthase/HD superfamily hydrolase